MRKAVYFGLAATISAGIVVAAWSLQHVRAVAEMAAPPAMAVPESYREWRYLTSGLDMTYTAEEANALPPNHDGEFDNVFVNPGAYAQFTKNGTWPDQTILVLENRAALQHASINHSGRTQGEKVAGVELHVKRNGHWAFYAGGPDGREHLIARPAGCYSCHEAHAAVDTTFVQFYPTLLPIAADRHVLSPSYQAETAAAHAE